MKKRTLLCILTAVVAILLTFLGTGMAYAKPYEGKIRTDSELSCGAKSAIMLDYDSGTVIYEKDPLNRLQIASMVKIMTLNLIFDEIQAGNLSYDTDVVASQNATSMGGSQAYLDANSTYKTEELIKSIIVASANDSCVAMAEHIAGSVDGFVDRMNMRAEEWGMNDTYFVNCTGLPAPNQYSCAKDVAIMSRKLFACPRFYDFSTIWMFDFVHPSGRVTQLSNTNKLVRFYEGCDGGKTGFTSEALSCLSATAMRGDTRLICVVVGAESGKVRNAEVSKLLNYGFANYETRTFFSAGDKVEQEIRVINGKSDTVSGVIAEDVKSFTKKGDGARVSVTFDIGEAYAPISVGDKLGEVKIVQNGEIIKCVDVLAQNGVKKKNYLDYLDKIAENW